MADRMRQLWNERPGLCIAVGAAVLLAVFVALAPLGTRADTELVEVQGGWPAEWGPITLAFGLIRYAIKVAVYGVLALVVMFVLRLFRGKPKPVEGTEPPVSGSSSDVKAAAVDSSQLGTDLRLAPQPETVPMSLGKLVTDLAYAVGKVEAGHRILTDRLDVLAKAVEPKPRPVRKRPAKKRGA